jgi:hypothetical protein
MSPGIHPLKFDKCFITTAELREANEEGIRLNFSRTLDLPDDLPDLKLPVATAWRHVSTDSLVNVRLMVLFATDLVSQDFKTILIDVTPERWERIKRNRIAAVT